MSFELITSVTIPKYKREYLVSKNVRAKYYEKGKKKLPMTYCSQHLKDTQGIREPDGVKYGWLAVPVSRKKVKRMVDYLVDLSTGQLVIANENQAGKEKKKNINGQGIYNNTIMKYDRDKMMGEIKDQLRMYVMSIPPITRLPIRIVAELWDNPEDLEFSKGQPWDVGNRMLPYCKAFEDVLKEQAIDDDNRQFVTCPCAPEFCPVEDGSDRKLVFYIYADRRPIIVNSKWYQTKLGDKLK